MAIEKKNFLTAELNQFAISPVRGMLADWGLNAQIMEVRIADSSVATILPGDAVKVVSSTKGVLTVDAAGTTDAIYGFMIWDAKSTKGTAGKYIRVLRDGGYMQMVTADALTAGDVVYFKAADGSVTKTGSGLGKACGIAVEDSAAAENGTLVRIEVMKQPVVA